LLEELDARRCALQHFAILLRALVGQLGQRRLRLLFLSIGAENSITVSFVDDVGLFDREAEFCHHLWQFLRCAARHKGSSLGHLRVRNNSIQEVQSWGSLHYRQLTKGA